MAVKKINTLFLEDDEPADHGLLIAIHSAVEVYRVVYQLNKYLEIQLERKEDLDFSLRGDVAYHPLYHYGDERNLIDYYCIVNCSKIEPANAAEHGLLFDSSSFYSYVIPEYKSADFLLRIEGLENDGSIETILKKIQLISNAYSIDVENLKSYNNLIFN